MTDGLLEDHLIYPGEAQKALRLSPRSMDKLDTAGILPKVRIPELGVVRYRLSDVLRLISGASEIEDVVREGTRPVRKGPRR